MITSRQPFSTKSAQSHRCRAEHESQLCGWASRNILLELTVQRFADLDCSMTQMEHEFRQYGDTPSRVVVLHGGAGWRWRGRTTCA